MSKKTIITLVIAGVAAFAAVLALIPQFVQAFCPNGRCWWLEQPTPIPPCCPSPSLTTAPINATATSLAQALATAQTLLTANAQTAVAATIPPQPPTATQAPLPTATQVFQPPTVPASINWQHNPILPARQGYVGMVTYTHHDFGGTSLVSNVPVLVANDQILLVSGYSGHLNVASVGDVGQNTHCFLLITRGPFNSTMDLLSSSIEIHSVTQEANSLTWTAEKSWAMKTSVPACANGIDVWVGR